MDNLDKAFELEKEYHSLRLNHNAKSEFDFLGKLKKLGYSPERYLEDKDNSYLKNLKIVYSKPEFLIQDISKMIYSEQNSILFIKDSEVVYLGTDSYNKQYCEENKIVVLPLNYSGGTIVTTKEDLGIVLCIKEELSQDRLLIKINRWITENVSKSDIVGNDILINGYKVLGSSHRRVGNKNIYYYQVSFDVNLDRIKKICVKEMKKEPRGLKSFKDCDSKSLIEVLLK